MPCLVAPRATSHTRQQAVSSPGPCAVPRGSHDRRSCPADVPHASTINTRAAHRRFPQKINTGITRTTRYPAHDGITATRSTIDPRLQGSPDADTRRSDIRSLTAAPGSNHPERALRTSPAGPQPPSRASAGIPAEPKVWKSKVTGQDLLLHGRDVISWHSPVSSARPTRARLACPITTARMRHAGPAWCACWSGSQPGCWS